MYPSHILVKTRTDSGFWITSETLKAPDTIIALPDNPHVTPQCRELVKASWGQRLLIADPTQSLVELAHYHQAAVALVGEGLVPELIRDFNRLVHLGFHAIYIRG